MPLLRSYYPLWSGLANSPEEKGQRMQRTMCRLLAIGAIALTGFTATQPTPVSRQAGSAGIGPAPLVLINGSLFHRIGGISRMGKITRTTNAARTARARV